MATHRRAAARALALAIGIGACGDNLRPPADAFVDETLVALRQLPGVHDAQAQATQTPGYRYYVLHFTQPVDHAVPSGPTFLQEVSLLHKSASAPLVVHTSGYWDYYLDTAVELSIVLAANQISIEHRFFGTSRPSPADWSKLTIEQMAADEHAIVGALGQLYTGSKLSTGGSKGGMTAVFYRRFFPDDVVASVPYVAPISFAAPDPRYPPFLDGVGDPTCRQAVRDAATEMLANRRAALLALAQQQAQAQGYAYTRIAIGPAVESAIDSLEWSFWQYYGVTSCGSVPAVSATDAAMWAFLDQISPVWESDDDEAAKFEAYAYQAYAQLGYPDGGAAYLTPYLMYADADYLGMFPTTPPSYDGGAAMHDIDGFVRGQGARLLFVYGQWDPWTAGAFALGNATDSLELVQAQGTHESHITGLATADEHAALARLAAWSGVTPTVSARVGAVTGRMPPEPHVPSAWRRALRAGRDPR